MTLSRLAAGLAAVITALLLQATLVAPIFAPNPVSLPAVLVAVVAINCGPGTGMSLGFSAGLLADLGSAHPAGVLALAWMVLGLVTGSLARPTRGFVRNGLIVAISVAVISGAVTVGLDALGSAGASLSGAVTQLPWTLLGDAGLALVLVPIARAFLGSVAMRSAAPSRPRPVLPRG
jgi:cell shape-determining protein MreD